MRTVPRERKTELLEALFARRVMRLGLESGGRWAESEHAGGGQGREARRPWAASGLSTSEV